MGTVHHKAMLVTSCNSTQLKKAYDKALKLFDKNVVTKPTGTGMNGYMSFVIVPCGSQLGWEQADQHELAMKKFTEFCFDKFTYEDGSSSVHRVMVDYGDNGLQAEDAKGNELNSTESYNEKSIKIHSKTRKGS